MKLFHSANLFTLVFLLALGSCSSEENLAPQGNPSFEEGASWGLEIFEKNGRLVFENQAVYDETVKILKNAPERSIDWENQFPNFTSMRKAYDAISEAQWDRIFDNASIQGFENIASLIWEEDRTFRVDRVVPLDYLATMVNQDGIIQIGNKICKYIKNDLIIIDESNAAAFEKLASTYSKDQVQHLQGVRTYSYIKRLSLNEGSNSLVARNSIVEDQCERRFLGGKRRVLGQIILHSRRDFSTGNWIRDELWIATLYEARKNKWSSSWNQRSVDRTCMFVSSGGQVTRKRLDNGNTFTESINGLVQCDDESNGRNLIELYNTEPYGIFALAEIVDIKNLEVKHEIHHLDDVGRILRRESCNTFAN